MVIGLLIMVLGGFSQQADIYIDTLDKKVYHDKIKSHSFGTMFGESHQYKMKIVQKIIFYEKPDISLTQSLKDAGVKVLYDYDNPSVLNDFGSVNKRLDTPEALTARAYTSQNIGVTMKVLGIGAMAAATILSVSKYPDGATQETIDKRLETIKGLALSGAVCFTVGIIIKLDGDRDLFELQR